MTDHQGKRPDQVTFSEVVTACCLGVLGVILLGWGLLAWAGR